jgi:acyl-CoA dehydrogenase
VPGTIPLGTATASPRTPADGPDEVHEILIAKNVLGRWHAGESWDFGN